MSDQTIYQVDQILLSFVRLDEIKILEVISYDPSKELFNELVQIFDTETKETISLIKEYCENSHFSEVSRLAHRLRSTSLNLGATRLSEILKRIEYMAQEVSVIRSEVDFLINSAEKESQSASIDLHIYLNQSKSL